MVGRIRDAKDVAPLSGERLDGDYVLSVTCPAASNTTMLSCGSTVYGSTVGLPNTIGHQGHQAGDVQYWFCPSTAGTVHISTCESNFNTWLHVQGPAVNYSCGGCGHCGLSDYGDSEVTISFLPDKCYSIHVDGFDRLYAYEENEGDYSLTLTCTAPSTTNNTNVTCPVYIAGANPIPELLAFAEPVVVLPSVESVLDSLAEGLTSTSGAELLLPMGLYDENSIPSFAYLDALARLILDGLHLLLVGGRAIDFLNELRWELGFHGDGFGLLYERSCSSGYGDDEEWRLSGDGFGGGPKVLPVSPYMSCVELQSLPETVDGLYDNIGNAVAWTSRHGKGRITFLGVIYNSPFLPMPSEWRHLLVSSFSATCGREEDNVTTITTTSFHVTPITTVTTTSYTVTGMPRPRSGVNVSCGSIVHGSMPDFEVSHIFCTPPHPSQIGDVLISTCGSSFDTTLAVREGLEEKWSCTYCGNCGANAELKMDWLAADTCYSIEVGGRHATGNYSLWVSCCDEGLCNHRGTVTHKAWGPAITDSPELCGCLCFYPYAGPTCSECARSSLSIFKDGTCQRCWEEGVSKSLVALHGTTVLWKSGVLHPECATGESAMQVSYRATVGEVTQQSDSLRVEMGACLDARQQTSEAVSVYANGVSIGNVYCAPGFNCLVNSELFPCGAVTLF